MEAESEATKVLVAGDNLEGSFAALEAGSGACACCVCVCACVLLCARSGAD